MVVYQPFSSGYNDANICLSTFKVDRLVLTKKVDRAIEITKKVGAEKGSTRKSSKIF